MSQNSAFPRLIAAFLSLTKFIRAAGAGTGTVWRDGGAERPRGPPFVAARAAPAPTSNASGTAQSAFTTTRAPRDPPMGRLSGDFVSFGFIASSLSRMGFELVVGSRRPAHRCPRGGAWPPRGASGTSGARPEASSADRHGDVDRLGTETGADGHGGGCGDSVSSEDVRGQPEDRRDEPLAPADDEDPDRRIGDRLGDGHPELTTLGADLVDAADRGAPLRGHGQGVRHV